MSDLAKKRQVRGGHRASAKRMMNEASRLVESQRDDDEYDSITSKLSQIKRSLGRKIDTLEELNSELIDLTKAEDVATEIDDSDAFRDMIEFAIIDINLSLSKMSRPTSQTKMPEIRENIGDSQIHTEKQSHQDVNSQELSFTSHQESPSRNLVEPDENTSNSTTPISENGSTILSSTKRVRVKLPKLELKKFKGDSIGWLQFWDTFESSIHLNDELSEIDKFNYLHTLMEGEAADAIMGLPVIGSNYKEAVAILKKRFGNKQKIINKHSTNLLNLDSVRDISNLKALRNLYDNIEANVRSLKSLGIPVTTYGALLTPIVTKKLPKDLELIISRELKEQEWNLDLVMRQFETELEARERTENREPEKDKSSYQSHNKGYRKPYAAPYNKTATATALYTDTSTQPTARTTHCTYCRGQHTSTSCKIVSNVDARRDILNKFKRCYICLRRDHFSRNCQSGRLCPICNAKHHVSICPKREQSQPQKPEPRTTQASQSQPQPANNNTSSTTLYTYQEKHHRHVFLQTARANMSATEEPKKVVNGRLLMDSGSQRCYITCRMKRKLGLKTIATSNIVVKTFGSSNGISQSVDVIELNITCRGGERKMITAYVVPLICQPIIQGSFERVKHHYPQLFNLTLADYNLDEEDTADIDVLIGMDHYWDFATSNVIRGETGPTAMETKFGWVLSGPAELGTEQNHNVFITTLHVSAEDNRLEEQLHRFWDVEAMGLTSTSILESLRDNLNFDGERYTVKLPWKQPHPLLPDNYSLSHKRFRNLYKRLEVNPKLLNEYDSIIKNQISLGIVEEVNSEPPDIGNVHYLPHHAVIRQNKLTTKLRIVYDASSKSEGFPSLNDCLYVGPSMNQKIFDIIVRFRTHRIGITADIEKAFLMVAIDEKDRDFVRFLWVDDTSSSEPKPKIFRFTRVVFGLTSSPFLLNATIKCHMEQYATEQPDFVHKFLRSIYVDDLTSGAATDQEAKEFYEQAKNTLASAGFNLRKFISNSKSLNQIINQEEARKGMKPENHSLDSVISEEDNTYTKSTLGDSTNEDEKILGVRWNSTSDQFIFDIRDIADYARDNTPTKRHVISVAAKFFDPLGYLSPFIVKFKLFFQELCRVNHDWDTPLEGDYLEHWNHLLAALSSMPSTSLPRYFNYGILETVTSYDLIGFCDASTIAYAAVIYLRINTHNGSFIRFIASKTRISPLSSTTIPRLELLSALILSRLINTVNEVLKEDIKISNTICFTDSKVAYYWIVNEAGEWKQFVQNRVNEIHTLTSVRSWRHCPGVSNPADLPSRGSDPRLFLKTPLWNNGPEWLPDYAIQSQEPTEEGNSLPEIISEMKKSKQHTVLLTESNGASISNIIDGSTYSNIDRLFRVTSHVLRFIRKLKSKNRDPLQKKKPLTEFEIAKEDLLNAEILWLREMQSKFPQHQNFENWKKQFDIYTDQDGILRCRGRLGNSDLPESTKFPVLIDRKHYLATLLVRRSHSEVIHSGVAATLTQLRSKYWIIRGRQFVRKFIHQCRICRRFDSKPYDAPSAPPLPEFRVKRSHPFSHVGVDFAGPMFVKTSTEELQKTWLCLYTCTVTRAVHLELVPDMSTHAFICSFRRFISRRGTPVHIISDNGKTFKAAAKILYQIQWSFNLEKAPWWGGIFERMIKSAKRCLKKCIGGARLTHDELSTIITEVEAVLNSRPISFVTTEDIEEPLTPSHLLHGRRLLDKPEDNIALHHEAVPSDLRSRFDEFNSLLEDFWSRWRNEYLLELRNSHNTGIQGSRRIAKDDVVIVHEDNQPRTVWKLGRVIRLITGNDGNVRGAVLRIPSKNGKVITLKRPVQRLYPLETSIRDTEASNPVIEKIKQDNRCAIHPDDTITTTPPSTHELRPKRSAATKAGTKIRSWIKEL